MFNNTTISIIILVLEAIFGFLLLFWGKNMWRFFLGLLGLLGGLELGEKLNNLLGIGKDMYYVLPIVTAILLVVILMSMLKISFVIAGGLVGWQFGELLVQFIKFDYSYILPIVLAVIGAIIISAKRNNFMMFAAALLGSSFLTDSVVSAVNFYKFGVPVVRQIFTSTFSLSENIIILLVIISLTILGIYSQRHRI